jgi:CubicO group peptidase (beta-lactamase class C family)
VARYVRLVTDPSQRSAAASPTTWPTTWPTSQWNSAPPDADVDRAALDDALAAIAAMRGDAGVSLATLVVHRGRIVAEQYGPATDADTPLISWSMAKTITQAMIGMLVGDGLLDIDAPAAVPEFAGTDKAVITPRHLLAMRSGLEFVEDYVDDAVSHCLDMLFGAGKDDHAHYAAQLPLLHPPDTVWNYSSGTTNILARLAGDVIAGGAPGSHEPAVREFLERRLFGPLGMSSASPTFDPSGTFVGSSYVHATARDFARFGSLYLHDGVWDGRRLLPEGWVDWSRTVTSVDPEPPHFGYGAHCWVWPELAGSLAAHGYEGQYIVVVPDRDLVLVQLSKVPAAVRQPLLDQLRRTIAAFAPEAPSQ